MVGEGDDVYVELAVIVGVSVAVGVGGTGVSVGRGVFVGGTSVEVGGIGVGSGVWAAHPLTTTISRMISKYIRTVFIDFFIICHEYKVVISFIMVDDGLSSRLIHFSEKNSKKGGAIFARIPFFGAHALTEQHLCYQRLLFIQTSPNFTLIFEFRQSNPYRSSLI